MSTINKQISQIKCQNSVGQVFEISVNRKNNRKLDKCVSDGVKRLLFTLKTNMESVVMENGPTDVDESQDGKGSQSAEIFQKFMYELFEKNGVLNDLRSCLRGHIISVLRSVQTGLYCRIPKDFLYLKLN